ncbi:HBR371Cp [Eremothecium sinecaudum]|uniref:HBR371Cp n=1 Tax=Eremothecium sinecaudum TaxID=45286 RepID=A0A109UXS0_9SACH|nr:HBR371Cp [Eremothecium sinecaudum]AMD19272.1 HBR371Cp [Eremothecium sinecaudum]
MGFNNCKLDRKRFSLRGVISNRKFVAVIGDGSTCSVELFNKNGKLYSVKRLKKFESEKHHADELKVMLNREYGILSSLDNDNVLRVLGFSLSDYTLELEYLPFVAYDVMRLEMKPSEDERKCFVSQLIQGVSYLHEKRVVHRDLKLENVMLAADCHLVKIIDFGHAVQLKDKQSVCYGLGGSEMLMAPEVLSKISYEGFPADSWSLGIIMYLLFNNKKILKFPWKSARESDTQYTAYLESGLLDNYEHDEICRRLLNPDPEQRASVVDVSKDPIFQYKCDRTIHDRTRRLCHRFWGEHL